FLTPYDWTATLFDAYRQRCRERGFPEPGPDRFAYLAMCHTADTDAEAETGARELLWYLQRERHPGFANPPGYYPPRTVAKALLGGAGKPYRDSFESLQEKGIVLAGNPDTMIAKVRYLHERCGVGNLLMLNPAGFLPTDQVRHGMKLFAEEVYPAIRELGE